MIFNEIYSVYYKTVARIIARAADGKISDAKMREIVEETAFSESVLSIVPAIKSGKWQVVLPDGSTPIKSAPSIPQSELERSWLKAITLDPRFRLFGVTIEGLEQTEPLFTADDYVVYDKYCDGDPFDDEGYVERFRFLLGAIEEGFPITVEVRNRVGRVLTTNCYAEKLEYSEKDDKFRLITSGCHFFPVINLAKLESVKRYEGQIKRETIAPKKRTVTLKVTDERNALERCLLHFAHLEKRVERLDEDTYEVKLVFDVTDDPEMVIRILSFGPRVEVVSPPDFRNMIIDKLKKQKSCGLK